jgi:hypothetical protein
VNYQKKGDRTHHPDCVPSLFSILEPIREDDVQAIVPNVLGDIKGHTMLGEVLSRLFGVPIKLHHDLSSREMYVRKRISSMACASISPWA